MNTEATLQTSEELPEQAKEKKAGAFRRGWAFTRALAAEKDLWARLRGARKGALLVAQGVTGIILLLSLPLVFQPVGIAACCMLVGAGLYGVRYGIARAWDSLENFLDKVLHGHNPMKKIRAATQSLAKKIASRPLIKKLQARKERLIEKVAQSPRFKKMAEKPFMKKLLNSRLAGYAKKGLDQKQQDNFLAALTVQGSLVAIAVCSIGLATHAAVIPVAAFVGGGVTVAAIAAACIVGTNALALYRGIKSLRSSYQENKRAKKALKKESTAEPSLSAAPQPMAKEKPTTANSAPVFNKQADRKAPPRTPAVLAATTQRRPQTAARQQRAL